MPKPATSRPAEIPVSVSGVGKGLIEPWKSAVLLSAKRDAPESTIVLGKCVESSQHWIDNDDDVNAV